MSTIIYYMVTIITIWLLLDSLVTVFTLSAVTMVTNFRPVIVVKINILVNRVKGFANQ
jgi:hypothetical protein